ncbi:tc1-like transposase protein [Trichonephila clavipes]|nr:tc1-like transposase protein [Trichonephila clavipes]
MSLEVDSDDFQELPEPHNQELGIDELIEMHEQDIEEHCVFKPSEIRRSNDGWEFDRRPHYTRAFGDGPRNFEPWSSDVDDTCRVFWEWLLYNVRKQVKTPTQSPDLNPIEHLWDYLDRQIRKPEIKSKNDLKKALLAEWQKIPSSVTQNLVKSVPSRRRAVIKAKGYPTNY